MGSLSPSYSHRIGRKPSPESTTSPRESSVLSNQYLFSPLSTQLSTQFAGNYLNPLGHCYSQLNSQLNSQMNSQLRQLSPVSVDGNLSNLSTFSALTELAPQHGIAQYD